MQNIIYAPHNPARRAISAMWQKVWPFVMAALLFLIWGIVGNSDLEIEMAKAQAVCEAQHQTLTEVSKNEWECR